MPNLPRRALIILGLINLFNYLDRYVVPPLIESLKRDPVMGHPSDLQLASLTTAFMVVYTLVSPIFGTLGDRMSRMRLVAFGVGLWSVATAMGGLVGSFAMLFVARAAVGIGEAAYGSISPTILADYFAPDRLGRTMSIFYCAIPVGSALGYALGGLVDAQFGWRAAFLMAGLPGIVLAFVAFTVPDPPRGGAAAHANESTLGPFSEEPRTALAFAFRTYGILARNRQYVLTCLGYAAYSFAMGGLAAWFPAFLERVRGVPHAEAGWLPGLILVVTGFLGTSLGGWIGDAWLPRNRNAFLWVSAIATLAAVPFAIASFTVASPALFWPAIAVSELLMFSSTGPINATFINIVSPSMRATAMAVQIFFIHLLGDVPSPVIIGKISDSTSLATAVLIVPVAILVSGLIWIRAATVERVESVEV